MFSKAESIIGHFNTEEIQRILPEIQRQAASKRDFIAPAAGLVAAEDGTLILNVDSFKLATSGNTFASWVEAEAAAEQGEQIIVQKGSGNYPLTRTAERQLSQRVGVPLDFIDRLRAQGQKDLAADIISQRLRRQRYGVDAEDAKANEDRYMLRTLDGKIRAVLSDRYRIIDNVDLFFAAAEKLETVGGELWQMRLSENRFEMLAVSRSIRGEVRTDRTFDPGDGWQSRWYNEGGDTQYAAISITNSETGGGSVNVSPSVMTRVCANFCVWAKTLRAVHLGKVRDAEEFGLIESAEVQAAESRLVWLKVREAIETVFSPERFAKYIDTLNAATQREVKRDVVPVLTERLATKYEISEDRAKKIMQNLMESRDYSQYGVTQAITVEAHAMDKERSADDAAELEAIGGAVAALNTSGWRELAATA